jgi:hypothetical protein
MTMRALTFVLMLGAVHSAFAASALYDMGTSQSAVMDGFTQVTEKTTFTPETGFGWDAGEGLKSAVQVYKDPIENKSRGSMDPPPIYTNALSEDGIFGDQAREFRVTLPRGAYHAYLMCGTSTSQRNQYFDFDVRVGEQVRRVRFEGSYQFRTVRMDVTVGEGPLAFRFEPRSKFVVCALLVWDEAEAGRIADLLRPIEKQMATLPPEELAKWKLDPPPPTAPWDPDRLSRTDMFRGYVVYHKPYTEPVYPATNPMPHELRPDLRIFASPGEYEPVNFEIRTIAPLHNVRVAVDDIGPVAGKTVDVRHVRYMLARPNYSDRYRYRVVPDILERFDSLELPADQSHRFWLTLQVPADAKPGIYDGQVRLTAERVAGQPVEMTVPVTLRVLDIKLLEDPSKIYGIYYYDPLDRWGQATDDVSKDYFWRKSDLEHADMLAHGTRNVTLSASCSPADDQGNFKADWTVLQAKLDMAARYGFKGPYVASINTGGVYQKYMKESYGSHMRGVKLPPPEFFAEMRNMAAFVESERVKHGWPEFLYYPIDEPSTAPDSVKFMTELLKAIREAGVKTYVTADPANEAFAPMRPYVSVWCTQPFTPDRDTILKDKAARDVDYWCYPNHISGENDHTPVAGARMTYGFGFWRSGFTTLIPWIYQSSGGDPFNYLDSPNMDFFNRSEEDGTPMPVALWEAFREGYDDYRYVYTLETLIEKARAAGKAAEADEAQRELQSVWDAIKVQAKYKYDNLWAPEEFDIYRWVVARAILMLHDAGVRE